MPKKSSAGVLLYRRVNNHLEVLLVHPGGPFWARKDLGSWSIPKGEVQEEEDILACAKREFKEETGHTIKGKCIPLSPLKQKSGKVIYAWRTEGDFDTTLFQSNTFSLEWPPRSGKFKDFPEVDKAEWFEISIAFEKILPGQAAFLRELQSLFSEE